MHCNIFNRAPQLSMIQIYGIYRNNILVYIGQTKDFYSRWMAYKGSVRRGQTKNMPIMRAMVKYGFDAFEFHNLVETETTLQADRLEELLIACLDPRYNVTRGGASTRDKYCVKVRAKISEAIRNRPRHLFRVTPIICLDTGEYFFSISEAQRSVGRPGMSHIRNHLRGQSSVALGRRYAYYKKAG